MINVRNTVCLSLLIAFATTASCALKQLAGAVEVPTYLLICGAIGTSRLFLAPYSTLFSVGGHSRQ